MEIKTPNWDSHRQKYNIILYADDLTVIAESEDKLQTTTTM